MGRLSFEKRVCLGSEHSYFNRVGIEGDVAQLALSGVVISEDTIVEHCHMSGGGGPPTASGAGGGARPAPSPRSRGPTGGERKFPIGTKRRYVPSQDRPGAAAAKGFGAQG